MSDIFREIEQEVRREEALKLWAKYQIPIIVLAVLIVAATAGWRFWQTRSHQQAEALGARYETALKLAHQGKSKEAEAALQSIAKTGPRGYALLAQMSLAKDEAAKNPAAAVKLYESIGGDQSVPEPIRDAARLRAAFLSVDGSDAKDIIRRLDPLAAPGNPYKVSARELLALLAFKQKDFQAAGHWLQMIVSDPAAPAGARATAQALLGLVAGAPRPVVTPSKPASAAPAPVASPSAKALSPAKPVPSPLKPVTPPAKPAASPASP